MTQEFANVCLIRALQASWSSADPEDFVSVFTPEGEFEDVTYGIRLSGHDALRAHSTRMKKHSAGLVVDVTSCDATATTGVAEWRLSHDYVGNFDGVDCTGVPLSIRGLSIYIFQDGRIARATDYWNYMEIVRAMRVIPREVRQFRTA